MPAEPAPSRATMHHSSEKRGNMEVRGSNDWIQVPAGEPGQTLTVGTDGMPAWSGGFGSAVDDVIITMNSTNPSARFGGTWTQIGQGRVLVGQNPAQSQFDTAGETGTLILANSTDADNSALYIVAYFWRRTA